MAFGQSILKTSSAPAGGPVRVMVVDDSMVIRGLLTRSLETDPAIKVVVSAGNGKAALEAIIKNDVEVVVLDIEMPVMDGMTALPQLIAARPYVQVIMASTLTLKGASISMKALSMGAADYVPKPTSTTQINGAEDFKADLIAKVKSWGAVARRRRGSAPASAPAATAAAATAAPAPRKLYGGAEVKLRPAGTAKPECLVIGSSTGGPQALFKVFQMMGPITHMPVFLTQHMPATFTTILAEHIAQASGTPAAEAKDGEPVVNGRIYVAPGDFHMTVMVENGRKVLRVTKTPPENFCRPAVDPMLRSITKVYGNKILFCMLTGMGQDGLKGAQDLVANGGTVIAQDEPTSVVWGMPGAVSTAGLCSAVLPLSDIGPYIRKFISRTGI